MRVPDGQPPAGAPGRGHQHTRQAGQGAAESPGTRRAVASDTRGQSAVLAAIRSSS